MNLFRVINETIGETVAVLGDLSIAIALADNLAADSGYAHHYAVVVVACERLHVTQEGKSDGGESECQEKDRPRAQQQPAAE